jgi:hypothetical protein
MRAYLSELGSCVPREAGNHLYRHLTQSSDRRKITQWRRFDSCQNCQTHVGRRPVGGVGAKRSSQASKPVRTVALP